MKLICTNLLSKQSYQFIKDDEKLILDGEEFDLDVAQINQNKFHLLHKGQSILAEFISFDSETKNYKLKLNNTVYEFNVKDEQDLLLESIGLKSNNIYAKKEIKAPIPGLILSILVTAGDKVTKGQPVLVLEAMKMENLIKTGVEGTVKSIKVKVGDKVDKGAVLVELEH